MTTLNGEYLPVCNLGMVAERLLGQVNLSDSAASPGSNI